MDPPALKSGQIVREDTSFYIDTRGARPAHSDVGDQWVKVHDDDGHGNTPTDAGVSSPYK